MNKATALRFLASTCDGLVFVGMMAFQIMHALGVPLPLNLVDRGASKAAVETLQYAKHRNISILLPKYFRCENYSDPMQSETFPAHGILDGTYEFLLLILDYVTDILDVTFEFPESTKAGATMGVGVFVFIVIWVVVPFVLIKRHN